MSLDQLRRRLDKLESRFSPAESAPWAWIITYPGESLEQKMAEMIAAGEMRPGQSFVHWKVIDVPGGAE